MRGTRGDTAPVLVEDGIIPAYAGNTEFHLTISLKSRDHPRVCGEHSMNAANPSGSTGSSPRMRGTLDYLTGLAKSVGIIPAYAGNTVIEDPGETFSEDHPRVCGEHVRGQSL